MGKQRSQHPRRPQRRQPVPRLVASDGAVVTVAQEALDGRKPRAAHVALPRGRLHGGAGAVEAGADGGGRVQAVDGPAPVVDHAAVLQDLRSRQVPRVGLDVVDRGAEAPAAREVVAQGNWGRPGATGEVLAMLNICGMSRGVVGACLFSPSGNKKEPLELL